MSFENQNTEGATAKAIEEQTSKLPSDLCRRQNSKWLSFREEHNKPFKYLIQNDKAALTYVKAALFFYLNLIIYQYKYKSAF